jgi:hypothetical protein
MAVQAFFFREKQPSLLVIFPKKNPDFSSLLDAAIRLIAIDLTTTSRYLLILRVLLPALSQS